MMQDALDILFSWCQWYRKRQGGMWHLVVGPTTPCAGSWRREPPPKGNVLLEFENWEGK